MLGLVGSLMGVVHRSGEPVVQRLDGTLAGRNMRFEGGTITDVVTGRVEVSPCTERQGHLKKARIGGSSGREKLALKHQSHGLGGDGLGSGSGGGRDLVVAKLVIEVESGGIIVVVIGGGGGGGIERVVPEGLGVEVRPGARRKVGEHLVEEIVVKVRLWDLVVKRDLRRVHGGGGGRVDSLLHFGGAGLHSHPELQLVLEVRV